MVSTQPSISKSFCGTLPPTFQVPTQILATSKTYIKVKTQHKKVAERHLKHRKEKRT